MTRTRRRRGCCGPIGLVVVLLVVLGLFVGADRVALGEAEKIVATTVKNEMGLAAEPAVNIHGFPFLTQAATNRFGKVELSGRGISSGTPQRPLLVDRMDLTLTDVRTANNYRTITAGGLTGTAYITWEELGRQFNTPILPEADGRVRVNVTASLYGQQVPFVITARPVLDVERQQIGLAEPQVVVSGYKVPDAVVQGVARERVPAVNLNLALPVRADRLRIGSDSVELGLVGRDIPLVS